MQVGFCHSINHKGQALRSVKPDRKLLYLLSCLVQSRMSRDMYFHVFVLSF